MVTKNLRIAVGTDQRADVVDHVVHRLRELGYVVDLHAPERDATLSWARVAESVAKRVSTRDCDQGILFCWTGTGVCMAANKVHGIRAALCCDAKTAAGARRWNDANVLVMSIRGTTPTVAREILDAWIETTDVDQEELEHIREVHEIESGRQTTTIPRSVSGPYVILTLPCAGLVEAKAAYDVLSAAAYTIRLSLIPELQGVEKRSRPMIVALIPSARQADAVSAIQDVVGGAEITAVPWDVAPPSLIRWLDLEPAKDAQ